MRTDGNAVCQQAFSHPLFLCKGCAPLVAVDRLVAAGINPESAADMVIWFIQQGDDAGLESYIREIESRHINGVQLHPSLMNHR